MAELNIRGKVVLVDDEDLPFVQRYKWFFTPQGYACTHIREDGRRRTISMHRLLLGGHDAPATDHRSRNKRDNRRDNIIPCSYHWSNRNRGTLKGKRSAYRGVSWNKGRWQVVIRVAGRLRWLGYYDDEHEAGAVAAPHFAGIAP